MTRENARPSILIQLSGREQWIIEHALNNLAANEDAMAMIPCGPPVAEAQVDALCQRIGDYCEEERERLKLRLPRRTP